MFEATKIYENGFILLNNWILDHMFLLCVSVEYIFILGREYSLKENGMAEGFFEG